MTYNYTKFNAFCVTKTLNLFFFLCIMLVATTSFGQTTLFQFNFENTTEPNIDNVVGTPSFSSNGVSSAGYSTYSPCQGSRMYAAESWKKDDYFRFEVNTTGYGNLSFSFCNRTDNENKINDFSVRVSSDFGANWDTVLATFTPTENNKTLTTITFPESAENASTVWIEIYKVNSANGSKREYLIDNATLIGYAVPTITSFTGSPSCSNSGASVVITGTNFSGARSVKFNGVNASAFTVNSNTKITATLPSNATTGVLTITTSNGTGTSANDFVISSAPSPTASASLTNVASGTNTTLSVLTTPSSQNTILLSEGFNSSTNTWTKNDNGRSIAAWSLRPDGYSYFYSYSYPTYTFHSNDNSQIYLSNSAAQGNSSVSTTLQSPSMSTIGYTSLSLDFYQFYLHYSGDQAIVEVSTNGTTWTSVATYNSTQGSDSNFDHAIINLNAYINKASLYIRFRYNAQFDWFWAIDNVTVSGNKTIDYSYKWTAFPSSTAGLPTAAGTFSASNNSIVASPTANTVYTVTATNPDTGCAGTSVVNVTTFSCVSSATIAYSGSPFCVTVSSSQSVTRTGTSGGTYTASPAGLSINSSTGAITPSASAAGTYTVTYTYGSGSCVGLKTSTSIAISSTLATPSVGIVTSEKCNGLGSVELIGLPVSGTINQSGKSSASYAITSSTMIISDLSAGAYTFTVSNGSCTSAATSNVVIKESKTNTWNGRSWSNGTPTNTDKIVFAGNYPPAVDPNVDLEACSCLVTGGAVVTIKSGRTLTITNEVTVVGPGSLIFENTASLVQINNDAVNSGNISYNRQTTSVFKSDYTYWSSPVFNQSLNISPSYEAGLFYSYDDFASPENWKKESSATIMQVGKGYIIRGSLTGAQTVPGFYNATFVGTPNNGVQTIAVGARGTSNLIGNPYPSAINADKLLAANNAVIEGTIYIWTHKSAIQLASNIAAGKAGSGTLAYTSDDYATYNATGGVAVLGGVKPNGTIAAGQSFFTTSTATNASVQFNNAMRVAGTTLSDGTGVNQQFYKTRNTKSEKVSEKVIEKNRIWLNLSNSEGAFKQTLLGYLTDATNDYDSRFDGESFDGNDFIDFYSINNEKNLTIQGRSLPFDDNDEVPLGYTTTIDGSFTIDIDQVDGVLANQAVFLEDKLTNTIFDLKSGDYTFTTVAGTFNDRFVLRYKNDSAAKTLATSNFDAQSNKVLVSNKNKQIKVNSFAEVIKSVVVYDLLGKQIYQNGNVNSNELFIANLTSSHQALIVKTVLQNGLTVTDKIMN